MKLEHLKEAQYVGGKRELKTWYVLYDAAKDAFVELNYNTAGGMSHRSDVTKVNWFHSPQEAREAFEKRRAQLTKKLDDNYYHTGKETYIRGRAAQMSSQQAAAKNNSIKKRLRMYNSIQLATIRISI